MGFGRRGLAIIAAGVVLSGLVARPGIAQEPTKAEPAPALDLTTRYRFIEQYTAQANQVRPGVVGVYRVAFKNTVQSTAEKPQGAPDRQQVIQQVVATERPAEVSEVDERVVKALVRRYDTVRITPDPWPKGVGPHPMDDLMVWYQSRLEGPPEVLVLGAGHPMLEVEYRFATSQVFVPDLALTLPEVPVRIGDTWTIVGPGATALVNHQVLNGTLTGKLLDVRTEPKTGDRTAVIQASGRVIADIGEAALNARIEFLFTPPAEADGLAQDQAKAEGTAPIDARGGIVKVVLAQTVRTRAAPGEERRRRTLRREFVLERRLGDGGRPLEVPDSRPATTETNSWLTFVDPPGRYHFRMPQAFQPLPSTAADTVFLGILRPEGSDLVRLTFHPGAQTRPDAFFKSFFDEWRQRGLEILPGATQTLPEAEWPGMRVVRTEAAARKGEQRVHLYAYVVGFTRNASLAVGATTVRDAPAQFRNDVEAMLKTFKLGPPGGNQ